MGDSLEKVIKDLFKLVDNENEKIQDAAVAALSGSVGEKRVANKILELIDNKSEIVRVRAISAISGFADFGIVKVRYFSKKIDKKKFENKLLKALECESEQVQAAALCALIKLNNGDLLIEKIRDAFESESEPLHLAGMSVLFELGIKDESVTERLLEDIESENALIQASAGKVLEKFIEPNEEILRKLSSILYNGKASKERIDHKSIPFICRFASILPRYPETPCDCIYEALRSLVERWEEKKSSRTTKANVFS